MDIENLIEKIVKEVLAKLEEVKTVNKILFLEKDEKETRIQFKNLIHNWKDIKFLESEEDISTYECILVKELSIDEFLSISEGKQINDKTRILREAFLKNKRVVIVSEGLEHRRFRDESNKNFYKLFSDKEECLKSFGVEFVHSSDLDKKLQSIGEVEFYNREEVNKDKTEYMTNSCKIDEKLITRPTLENILLKTNANEIKISKDTIITSLAEDYIREKDLKVSIES